MNKQELSKKLSNTVGKMVSSVENLDNEYFFRRLGDKWSIGENMVHLAKSTKAFNNALGLPKPMIANFGKVERPYRSYDEVVAHYHAVLATGVRATGGVEPNLSEGDFNMNETIARFKKQHDALIGHLDNWTDEELDEFSVPHPVLGLLSLREMFYFMDYHTSHHQVAIDRILQA